MRTTRVAIHLKFEAPGLYRFGYSTTDKMEDVSNWQNGNPIFQNVGDGDKYFFAENLYIDDVPILKLKQTINCGTGQLEILSISERIISGNPLESDWVDEVTVGDSDVVNPLEGDWIDEVTIESGAVLEIQSVTERVIVTPLKDDWVDDITEGMSLEILSVTETAFEDFNLDFNEDYNT